MSKLILVPDILPNNLRIIRDMRGLTIKKVAEDLKIDRNFLSAVEVCGKNFSGKTTIRAMKYYDITFYQMYDVKGTRILPYVFYEPIELACSIKIDITDDKAEYDSEKELLENISFTSKEIKKAIEEVINMEYKKVGKVDNYVVNKKYLDNNVMILEVSVDYLEQKTEQREFHINFVENENKQLEDMLRFRGFPLTIEKQTINIDGINAKIEDDMIIFNRKYKFSISDDPKEYIELNEISLDDSRIKVERKRNKIVSVSFNSVRREINNLKAIRTLTNLSIDEMHQSLGLSYNGYINLELGNQKISSKIMWRLVKMLKVPLELIINVDEYFDKYCQHDKKIRKPRNNDEDEA